MKSPKLNSTKISLENILSRLDATDHAPVKLIFIVLYILGAILIRSTQSNIAAVTERIEFISPMAEFAAKNIFSTYLIGGGIAVTILMLIPLGKRTVQEQSPFIKYKETTINAIPSQPKTDNVSRKNKP